MTPAGLIFLASPTPTSPPADEHHLHAPTLLSLKGPITPAEGKTFYFLLHFYLFIFFFHKNIS